MAGGGLRATKGNLGAHAMAAPGGLETSRTASALLASLKRRASSSLPRCEEACTWLGVGLGLGFGLGLGLGLGEAWGVPTTL